MIQISSLGSNANDREFAKLLSFGFRGCFVSRACEQLWLARFLSSNYPAIHQSIRTQFGHPIKRSHQGMNNYFEARNNQDDWRKQFPRHFRSRYPPGHSVVIGRQISGSDLKKKQRKKKKLVFPISLKRTSPSSSTVLQHLFLTNSTWMDRLPMCKV